MKNKTLLIMLILLVSIQFVAADRLWSIYVKPSPKSASTDFGYTFNFTNYVNFTGNGSCSQVNLSISKTITTDSDGIGFVQLNLTDNLSIMTQYMCEYRNGTIRKIHTIPDSMFRDVQVIDLNATGEVRASKNMSASWFIGKIDCSWFNGSDSDFCVDKTINNETIRVNNIMNNHIPNNISSLGDIYVNTSGDTMTGTLDMGNNRINLSGTVIKNLIEKNTNIAGPALGFYQTGPSGQNMPHLILQSGGPTQATTILRSVMIANEIKGFHNTSDATDCSAYMANISETLKIDCNTTTTGADLLLSDDLQVIGDAWLQDREKEWHFMERVLSNMDEHQDDTILTKVRVQFFSNGSDTILNLYNPDGTSIEVNVDRVVYDWIVDSVNVTLLKGTNESPQINYVTVQESGGSLVLKTETSYPGSVEHADVARVFVGDDGYVVSYNPIMIRNYEGPYKFYERFEKEGSLYVSGFTPSVSQTQFNVSDGTFNVVVYDVDCGNKTMVEGFYWVNNSGGYTHCTDLSCINQYSDGTSFTNKFMNLVWGVVPVSLTSCNLVAVVQGYPGAGNEYVSADKAEADKYVTTNYFPPGTELSKTFVPVALTLLDGTNDDFDQFGNNLWYRFLGGKVTSGGGAPSPAPTDHSALDNLNWSVAGHAIDENIVSQYNISASWFIGKIDCSWINGSDSDFCVDSNASGYVPYTGATSALNLGNNDFTTTAAVGIGTSSIASNAKLHIQVDAGSSLLPSMDFVDVIIEDISTTTDSAVLSIMGSKGLGSSEIRFGDNSSEKQGEIIYRHDSDSFNFTVNGVPNVFIIDSNGNVIVGGDILADSINASWNGSRDYSLTSVIDANFTTHKSYKHDNASYADDTSLLAGSPASVYLDNTDSNLTEDNVESYMFDDDNTANFNMSTYETYYGDMIYNSSGIYKRGGGKITFG